MQRFHCRLAVALFALAIPAYSAAIALDPDQYGHVVQTSITGCNSGTDGTNSACGPTAALNSLVFLQNRYPGIYTGTNALIPHQDGNTTEQDQIQAGETLACYMGCGSNGTSISNFIQGKQQYFEATAPNTTSITWMNIFDQNGAYPTFNWLFNELSDGEDIELLVGFYSLNPDTGLLKRDGGHYVTLYGISSATNDGNGSISFVDPADGTNESPGTFLAPDGSIRTTDYLSGTSTVTIVEAAVSESPVPEPATFGVLGSGVLAVWVVRRRKRV
jgi:hypothetical protein